MNETPYNADDPAFLLSRSLDEELSDEELRRLESAMASSGALRLEAENLRALDELVKRWAARKPEVDFDCHAVLTVARAGEKCDDDELRKVDRLIERWGSQGVSIEAQPFTAAVMERVTCGPGHKPRRRLIFKIAAPLAAAAALAFAITASMWQAAGPQGICNVRFGPATPVVASSPVVLFGRAAVDSTIEPTTGISLGTVGSAPLSALPGGSPPL